MKVANSRTVLFATVALTRLLGRFSARLAGLPAYLLWFVPWTVPVSERGLQKQARWLETTQPFVVRTSVGRIAGFTAGEGPLVLLIHGLGERGAVLGASSLRSPMPASRWSGSTSPATGAAAGR